MQATHQAHEDECSIEVMGRAYVVDLASMQQVEWLIFYPCITCLLSCYTVPVCQLFQTHCFVSIHMCIHTYIHMCIHRSMKTLVPAVLFDVPSSTQWRLPARRGRKRRLRWEDLEYQSLVQCVLRYPSCCATHTGGCKGPCSDCWPLPRQ